MLILRCGLNLHMPYQLADHLQALTSQDATVRTRCLPKNEAPHYLMSDVGQ